MSWKLTLEFKADFYCSKKPLLLSNSQVSTLFEQSKGIENGDSEVAVFLILVQAPTYTMLITTLLATR